VARNAYILAQGSGGSLITKSNAVMPASTPREAPLIHQCAVTTASNTDVNVTNAAGLDFLGGVSNNNSLTLNNTGSGTLHVGTISGTA